MRQRSCLNTLLFTFLLMISISSFSHGQEQSQYDKGTPPQHAAGVSLLGSYSSTDLGSVNLSNGALNFKIPLTTIGGRGFSIPLTLNYSSKVWSASSDTDVDRENQLFSAVYADYANIDNFVDIFERIGPGWTIGAAPMIFNRIVRINQLPPQTPPTPGNPNPACYTFTVPKLTVMLPDKGEIEFRDDLYDGKPLSSDCGGLVSVSRGRRWHATDGSGTIYISDIDNAGAERFGDLSGVVITADGTRYRFSGSRCTSITDRNGNRIDIEYSSQGTKVEFKDQLGRITKIEQFVADPDNPNITLAVLVTIPGYSGNRYIKIKRDVMSANYRSDITPPSQVCTGLYDPLSKGYSSWCGSSPTILFSHSYGAFVQRIDNQQVLTEVILPDQRSLRFKYNTYGEVAEAQLPTGGKLWYDYEYQSDVPVGNSPLFEIGGAFHTEVREVDRALIQRRVFDGSSLQARFDYFYSGTGAGFSATEIRVINNTPVEVLLRNERHLFLPALRYTDYPGGTTGAHDGTYYSLWSTGVEWRTEILNADGTVVLKATEKDWEQRALVQWSGYPQEQPANDNRIKEERSYLETGMMAKVKTFYDQYNNPTEIKEYDFDQTLKRHTVTSYISVNNNSNYVTDDTIHLLRLPNTQTIFDGLGNQKSKTVTEYDVYTGADHAELVNYSSVSQHDSDYGSTKKTRGNPTRIGTWLNTTGTYLYTYPRYDVLGNVISMKDARGNVSTISFADDFGDGSNPGTSTQNPSTPTYAFPTLITSPPPLPGAPVHTARSQYDYATGLLTGFRDRNNVVTQTIYNDPFNRPTQVKSAVGVSGVESHINTYYAPQTVLGITLAKNDVLSTSDLNTLDDKSIKAWTVTDGFGRTTETWKSDPEGDVKVISVYDALSRVKQTSNPFRPATESAVYTTSVYDLAGRVTSVTTPDGAAVTTSYSDNEVTVTDQAGKARKSVSDALGRLIKVIEDPDQDGLNYETTYTYDTLNSLVVVTQGTQQRFFLYDSLKRLIRSRNPEQGTLASLELSDSVSGNSSWSIGYEYDDGGNLTKRTDARGVVSTYAYDALNRNTTIDYSDTSIHPDVKRFYDGATKGIGRFWYAYKGDESADDNVEKTIIDEYDESGRPLAQQQSFKLNNAWKDYPISRTYNLAGGVVTQTYPSNRTVSYSYNSAGQATSFSGTLGNDTRTYATGITYTSWGSLAREQFGTNTPVYKKQHYNVRGQLCDVRASNANDEWGGEFGALVNHYSTAWVHCGSGSDNNGNVLMSQTIINSFFTEDRYSYDRLNRLESVTEFQNGTTPAGTQAYDYDRWGNRTLKSSSTLGVYKEFTVDPDTNRLGVPTTQTGEMTYDASGNLTIDTYTGAGAREYDAENKMTRAWGGNNQWQEYIYNADGQRTRRKVDGQETWQIYGMDGELLAEYGANGSPSVPRKEYGYRNGELLVTAGRENVALSANGGVATASSSYSNGGQFNFTPAGANNGNRSGAGWGSGEGWNDNSPANTFPDWLRIDFNGSKTIDEIDVFTGQDNWQNPSEPTDTMTFSTYGLTGFEVQYWTGTSWNTVSGGNVTGNNKVWRKLMFAPITTSKIRVLTNASIDGYSRITELEAWEALPRTNVARASAGGTASATSSYSCCGWNFTPAGANNGNRSGSGWGSGEGWNDNPPANTFPDALQIDFNDSKTIDEIDVFTAQDNWQNPSEPTESMTFSTYGLTAFDVQYWNGSSWTTVPGGSVSGNNKVWRKFTFAPITTNKIRVLTNASVDGYSRLTEVEAWGHPANGGGTVQWLVSDHLGTPRMVIDQTGSLANVKRHDYLPFGEELLAGTGGRSPSLGYTGGDGVRQQFTAKERDPETGLDYFSARYYSSLLGRFTGVDPLMASGRASLPQSWNRYSYVLNNPLNLTDPSGLEDDDPQDPKKKQDPRPGQPQPTPSQTPLPNVTIKTTKDPRAVRGTMPRANVSMSDGTYVTGVVAPITVTVTDESGKPLEGLTLTEKNKVLEAEPALPFRESEKTVTTDANGSVYDLVYGNATVSTERLSPKDAIAAVEKQVESRVRVVSEQTITISAPGQGVIATAVYTRTITNLDNGNRRPATNAAGRHVNNFSIDLGPVTVTKPKSP